MRHKFSHKGYKSISCFNCGIYHDHQNRLACVQRKNPHSFNEKNIHAIDDFRTCKKCNHSTLAEHINQNKSYNMYFLNGYKDDGSLIGVCGSSSDSTKYIFKKQIFCIYSDEDCLVKEIL